MNRVERNLPRILAGVGVLLLLGVIAQVIASSPPRSFTMLTGRRGGAYYLGAQMYQNVAERYGFTINIVETAGSVEALKMLEEGKGDVAFIQGGIAKAEDADRVSALATVGYEPVWIAYRKELASDEPLNSPVDLQGERIAIGEPGSGTNALARLLLTDYGMTEENSTLLEMSSGDALAGLRSGEVDAAFFVLNALAPILRDVQEEPSIELMTLKDAEALQRRHRFLTMVTLPRGTISLVDNVPRTDLKMVAPSANLVFRKGFHPDLQRLLAYIAVELHGPGGFFAKPGEFPNPNNTDIPVTSEAKMYLQRINSGAFTLDRYVPFRLAAMFDRYLLFVVPLLLIALPMLSRSPMLYQVYMRRKVNRWYKEIRKIETHVDVMEISDIDAAVAELERVDDKLAHELSVSNEYMPNLYALRTHIDYVIRTLQKRKSNIETATDTPATL